ncbi:response regulator [Alicyclobacillus acidocaldarius]|uniref:Response regulator receiver protein n=1 Tax=Alicyclobacillus acidocaldarius subsp. acidocaldarius (strain ATCC 27009 / DSM 446 / BCRC 14685 / JCM 5260 / KCTC 1825 / NBRC 15652 / NCIMB 11725 / NRRL B-14509 / 104-IA) TaxID=521098 RepID=C8WYI1_ALIAD|nr:response regulator [Alicyclobacillus acidocaldarius]ACV60075.1 response regulator receiver protein [Alicyclobacillus acidocaldarius subsp. acidocaldarius DSM 446]
MIKVLLIDDFDETLESLAIVYSLHHGVEIVGRAHNAEEAWNILSSREVDFISIDIQLGQEDGLNLCREILNKYPDKFVVLCSVEASDVVQSRAFEAGASYFLPKPIGLDDVRKVVDVYSNRNRRPPKDASADDLLRLLDLDR